MRRADDIRQTAYVVIADVDGFRHEYCIHAESITQASEDAVRTFASGRHVTIDVEPLRVEGLGTDREVGDVLRLHRAAGHRAGVLWFVVGLLAAYGYAVTLVDLLKLMGAIR